MAYIIKNTSGLINTRLTDVGRRYISQGAFNISYFQIGDSEVNYSAVTNYNQVNNNILMPAFNAQNDTGSPQSNKQNITDPKHIYIPIIGIRWLFAFPVSAYPINHAINDPDAYTIPTDVRKMYVFITSNSNNCGNKKSPDIFSFFSISIYSLYTVCREEFVT